MKTIAIPITVLVLTALLMTGCGCRNSKPLNTMPSESTSAPTTRPTTEATTAPTTEATTQPTTAPTEEPTDNGNGPLSTEDENGGTTGAGDNAKARRIPRMN